MENLVVVCHSFSASAKFSEKLKFLATDSPRTHAYQGVRNVSFSENFGEIYGPFK